MISDKKKYFNSICNIRQYTGWGCGGCVLNGEAGCPKQKFPVAKKKVVYKSYDPDGRYQDYFGGFVLNEPFNTYRRK